LGEGGHVDFCDGHGVGGRCITEGEGHGEWLCGRFGGKLREGVILMFGNMSG
jgi:hypothetical protein